MLTNEQQEYAAQAVRTLQIIVAALIAGPFAYLAFVLIASEREGAASEESSPMLYFGLAFAMAAILAAIVVPRVMAGKHRAMIARGESAAPMASYAAPADVGDVGPLLAAYQVKTIVGAAMLEGAAFYNIYLYMAEQSVVSVAVAVLLLLGIALIFPFRGRVIAWLEGELTAIKQLREFNK